MKMKRGLRRVAPQSNMLTVLAGKQPGGHASCVSVTPSTKQNLNITIKSWRWKQPNLECTGQVRPTLRRPECEPAWLHPLPPVTLANQHLPLSDKPTKNTRCSTWLITAAEEQTESSLSLTLTVPRARVRRNTGSNE